MDEAPKLIPIDGSTSTQAVIHRHAYSIAAHQLAQMRARSVWTVRGKPGDAAHHAAIVGIIGGSQKSNCYQFVHELTKLGAVVWDLADLGGEVLDIIVFWRGQARPVEIKPANVADLTEKEMHSIQRLQLVGVQAIVATSTDDILNQWAKGEQPCP